MREDEFGDYMSYFIQDYKEEISENFRISLAAAAELENHLGYLWYNRVAGSEKVFICDFHILPSFQNQGFGKSALTKLDSDLAKTGVKQIRLRVAMANKIALRVYETSGFRATGTNMFKEIGTDKKA